MHNSICAPCHCIIRLVREKIGDEHRLQFFAQRLRQAFFPLCRLRSRLFRQKRKIQFRAAHRHFPLVALMQPGLDRTSALQGLQPLPPGVAQTQCHFELMQFQFRGVVIDVVQTARDRSSD